MQAWAAGSLISTCHPSVNTGWGTAALSAPFVKQTHNITPRQLYLPTQGTNSINGSLRKWLAYWDSSALARRSMQPAPQHIIIPGCSTVTYVTVQFCYTVSNSLWPHGLQHARSPCPSLSPWVCPSSRPLNWWCHPTISSPAAPILLLPSIFPRSGSLPKVFLWPRDKIYFYSQYWPKNNMRNNSNCKVLWHFTFWKFCLFSFLSEQHPKLFLFLASHPLCESRWQARPYLTIRKWIFPLLLVGHHMTYT